MYLVPDKIKLILDNGLHIPHNRRHPWRTGAVTPSPRHLPGPPWLPEEGQAAVPRESRHPRCRRTTVANIPVNFEQLKTNHPSSTTIWNQLSGIPEYVDETCCVQISYALNRAGSPIQNYEY